MVSLLDFVVVDQLTFKKTNVKEKKRKNRKKKRKEEIIDCVK